MKLLRSIFSPFVRTLAFPRKEIFEILRQPRLILTLVAGPFLILLLVGVGYRIAREAVRDGDVVRRAFSFRCSRTCSFPWRHPRG